MQNTTPDTAAKWKSIAGRHRIARMWRDEFAPRLSIFLQIALIVAVIGSFIWLISVILRLLSILR